MLLCLAYLSSTQIAEGKMFVSLRTTTEKNKTKKKQKKNKDILLSSKFIHGVYRTLKLTIMLALKYK